MYLVGAPHAHKSDTRRLLEKVVSERQSLVTDAEVLQEILHRYVAIDRRDAIQPAFDALIGIVDQVLAVDRPIAERAKQIVLGYRQLSAREASGDGATHCRFRGARSLCALPVFNPAVDIQHRLPVPCRVARIGCQEPVRRFGFSEPAPFDVFSIRWVP